MSVGHHNSGSCWNIHFICPLMSVNFIVPATRGMSNSSSSKTSFMKIFRSFFAQCTLCPN